MIDVFAMLCSVVGQLNQDRGIFIHRPQAFAALDALPHIFRGDLNFALVEKTLADFFDTPVIATQLADDSVPAFGATFHLLPAPERGVGNQQGSKYYLEQWQYHVVISPASEPTPSVRAWLVQQV